MTTKVAPFHIAKEELHLAEKIAQLFMPAAFINDTEAEIKQLEALIRDTGVGGLCFFHSRASAATNFEGKKEIVYNEHSLVTLKKLIHRYQQAAKYPLLISIDAEWGLAMRMENTPQYPYAITLGALQSHAHLIYEVGKHIANDCKAAGIHWNLAPVVDINNNPDNPVIGYRSFGSDKEAVLQKAKAFIAGATSEGVLSCIKHFPGHGDTATDSHLGLPIIAKTKEELWNNELYPFKALIDEGIEAVMVGHLAVPVLSNSKVVSATISRDIIKGVLRNELGFKGVVISDALNMHSVSKHFPTPGTLEWRAFDAGNDMLCFAEHTKAGIAMILKKADVSEIEASFERIWRLKEKAINASEEPSTQSLKDSEELNTKIARESLSLLKGTPEGIKSFQREKHATLRLIGEEDTSNLKAFLADHKDTTKIILHLYPPHIKPKDNFGFHEDEIEFINTLLSTKEVILYVFGNPYVLSTFNGSLAHSIVLVYQNLDPFVRNADAHLNGQIVANGRLPITLKRPL